MSMLDQISGIEGLEMNFFGSSAASDIEISFKNVSYYSSYTPKPKVSKDQSSAPSDIGLGDGLWPGASKTSTTGGSSSDPSSFSDNALFDQPLNREIVQADLASGGPKLPTDLNPVPEPRYFLVEILIAALSIGIWLKRQQGRQVL